MIFKLISVFMARSWISMFWNLHSNHIPLVINNLVLDLKFYLIHNCVGEVGGRNVEQSNDFTSFYLYFCVLFIFLCSCYISVLTYQIYLMFYDMGFISGNKLSRLLKLNSLCFKLGCKRHLYYLNILVTILKNKHMAWCLYRFVQFELST